VTCRCVEQQEGYRRNSIALFFTVTKGITKNYSPKEDTFRSKEVIKMVYSFSRIVIIFQKWYIQITYTQAVIITIKHRKKAACVQTRTPALQRWDKAFFTEVIQESFSSLADALQPNGLSLKILEIHRIFAD